MSEKKKRIPMHKFFLDELEKEANLLNSWIQVRDFRYIRDALNGLEKSITDVERVIIPNADHQKEIVIFAVKKAVEIEETFKAGHKPCINEEVDERIKKVIQLLKNIDIGK